MFASFSNREIGDLYLLIFSENHLGSIYHLVIKICSFIARICFVIATFTVGLHWIGTGTRLGKTTCGECRYGLNIKVNVNIISQTHRIETSQTAKKQRHLEI